jgi:hypothetical protein
MSRKMLFQHINQQVPEYTHKKVNDAEFGAVLSKRGRNNDVILLKCSFNSGTCRQNDEELGAVLF